VDNQLKLPRAEYEENQTLVGDVLTQWFMFEVQV
jgi:hypothetical protein